MDEIKTMDSMFSNMLHFEEPKVVEECDKDAECAVHGKYQTHYIKFDNGSEIFEPRFCPKCEEERILEHRQREAEASRIMLLEDYRRRNISPEFFDKSLDDYVATTKGQKAALKAVEDIVSKRKGKLILIGTNGCGKTMLGNIAVKIMGGKIYTMYEIATRIRQSYIPGAKETELDILNELINEPLLVIDEVGRLKMSEAVQDWFSYVLDKRHTYNKPYFIIGNLHFKNDCEKKENGGCPKCFENYFDTDILSRLTQDSIIIEIIANDHRREEHSCSFITDRR
jgi:DNA replication protein DnaC